MLNRWASDGRLDRQIPCPARRRPCPCFGGPDMKTIFITSLRQKRERREAGGKAAHRGIFALEVEVPGVPVAKFKG